MTSTPDTADAKTKIAQHDYAAAFRELVKVDPNSTLFAESDAMISEISPKIETERQEELEREKEYYEQQRAQAMKEYEDSVELEKQKIAASREIASKVLSAGSMPPKETMPVPAIRESAGSTTKYKFLTNILKSETS